MDEEIKTLEAQIESLHTAIEDLGNTFNPKLAKQLLEVYEEYEITVDGFCNITVNNGVIDTNDDKFIQPEQYIDLLVLYFITDNWHNPAKFLWKRIPETMKRDKALKETWSIGKFLYTHKYQEAAGLIAQFTQGRLSNFLKAGYHHIMHAFLDQAYENIDDDTYRTFMGFSTEKEQKAFVKYYNEEVKPKVEAEKEENVEISSDHLNTLKKLAQFIEKENKTQIEREA
mmetsp:Transcript_16717/g.14632  ORF Transcript_16717/g.14632 Transcript_16717/m.14632 type:complete len:228 (+) Transcript_16717:29-712(+)